MKAVLSRIAARFGQVWDWLREVLGLKRLDISKINGQLWCGAAISTDKDVRTIEADGITADIDCRLEFDDRSLIAGADRRAQAPQTLENHPKIAYCRDGVADDGHAKPVEWFATAWDFAKPIFESGGVVLTHCAAGVNRGPSMAYFLLRANWGAEPAAAFALIKEKRPVAQMLYRDDADRAIVHLGLGG